MLEPIDVMETRLKPFCTTCNKIVYKVIHLNNIDDEYQCGDCCEIIHRWVKVK